MPNKTKNGGSCGRSLPAWAQDILQNNPPILDRDPAAAIGGFSTRTLDRRIRDRQIEAVRVGSRVLVPARSLVEFLARGSTHAAV